LGDFRSSLFGLRDDSLPCPVALNPESKFYYVIQRLAVMIDASERVALSTCACFSFSTVPVFAPAPTWRLPNVTAQ
jgi:hypothetical protein